jgi:hypothetical protein
MCVVALRFGLRGVVAVGFIMLLDELFLKTNL